MFVPSRGIPRALIAASFAAATWLTPAASAKLDDYSSISTTNPTVDIEHSVQVVQDGNTIYAYSGLSRRWATLRCLFGTPTWDLSNEHVIVQDGPVFYGFSSRSGRFTALFPISGSADLLPNASPQSWFSVVADDANVHFYSAIDGEWHSSSYPVAPTVDTNGRLCVVVDDGTTVWGISAYFGNPVPLLVSGASAYSSFGNLAVANSSTDIHCFSAHHNTWATMPVAGPPTITNGFNGQPGFICIQDGSTISFYSGQSGTFTTLPAAPSSTVMLHRMCAAVVDGLTAYAYSGARGEYQSMTFTASPTVTVSHFFCIFGSPTAAYAYSATENAFAAALPGVYDYVVTQVAAIATPIGSTIPASAYSCLLNQWLAAPSIPNAEVYRAANSIVLVNPTGGMYGFAPRFLSWVPLPGVYPDTVYQGNSQQGPGLFTAVNGNDLHLFNTRSGKWRSITMSASLVAAKPHWNASIYHDGINAYAFGAFNDRWSTIPLITPTPIIDAQIYCANVYEYTRVTAYTTFAQLTCTADFPEYWRLVGTGGRFRLDLSGEPFAQTMMIMGFAPASLVTKYGTLLLDPTTMLIFAQPNLSDAGLADITLTLPDNPNLAGFDLLFQAAIYGPTGLYLTNGWSVMIM